MSLRPVLIGAMAPLVLIGTQALADWRSPIAGAPSILPSRFTPQRFDVVIPAAPPPPTSPAPARPPAPDAAPGWTMPLLDRDLTEAEKAEPLDGELIEAIGRIEPLYDPTRVDGPDTAPPTRVSGGSAEMSDVFGERWRRLDLDANVDRKASPLARAWQGRDNPPCDAFAKVRTHAFDDPALTALDPDDCAALRTQSARGYLDQPISPVAVAWIGVPVFAAPLPGSRMSSADFWAARRAKIEEIQARLRRKWEKGSAPPPSVAEAVLRP